MSKSFSCESGAHDECKPPSERLLSTLPAALQAKARGFKCSCPCHGKTSRVVRSRSQGSRLATPSLDAPGYSRYPGQVGLNRRDNAIRVITESGGRRVPAYDNARRILVDEFGISEL